MLLSDDADDIVQSHFNGANWCLGVIYQSCSLKVAVVVTSVSVPPKHSPIPSPWVRGGHESFGDQDQLFSCWKRMKERREEGIKF